jgi:phosphatidylinositol glycan class V
MKQRDVGLLRYWKFSNLPLFVLAAPMLVLLIGSGRWSMGLVPRETTSPTYKVDHYKTTDQEAAIAARTIRLLQSLAYPQLVLAGLAITNYHVQIITRMSSGYPIWYIWLAYSLLGWSKSTPPKKNEKRKHETKKSSMWRWQYSWESVAVKYMVVYGLVQGGLFASFLPPA